MIIKFSSKLQLYMDWKINKNIYRKQDIYNYFNIWRSHTRQASPVPIQYKIPITIIKRCSYKPNFLKIKLVKNVYLNMYLLLYILVDFFPLLLKIDVLKPDVAITAIKRRYVPTIIGNRSNSVSILWSYTYLYLHRIKTRLILFYYDTHL